MAIYAAHRVLWGSTAHGRHTESSEGRANAAASEFGASSGHTLAPADRFVGELGQSRPPISSMQLFRDSADFWAADGTQRGRPVAEPAARGHSCLSSATHGIAEAKLSKESPANGSTMNRKQNKHSQMCMSCSSQMDLATPSPFRPIDLAIIYNVMRNCIQCNRVSHYM